MSHGFRLVAKGELPAEWQKRSTPEQLLQRARTLGCPEGQTCMEHVVFCIPEYPWVQEWVDWLQSRPSTPNTVGFCLQTPEDWRTSAKPGALARLRKSLMSDGHPGFECLGRAFSPCIRQGATMVAPGSSGPWGGQPGWTGEEESQQ